MQFIKSFGSTFKDPVKFVVVIGCFFGVIFMLLTPPFETPDEPVHFFRAYQVSTLSPVPSVHGVVRGGWLPISLDQTVWETTTHPVIAFQPGAKYGLGLTKRALTIPLQSQNKKLYDLSATASYAPLAYLPQAVGVGLARILQLPAIIGLYLGRVSNLAAWLVMAALAVHLIPRRKWLLAYIVLLPMAVFQAISLSADVTTVGLVLVFIAYILRCRESKAPLTYRQQITLLALGIVMSLTKPVMFSFLPLALLLPNRLLGTRLVAWAKKAMFILVPFTMFVGWMVLFAKSAVNAMAANGQNPAHQLSFIVHNPHSFVNVLWNTNFFSWGDTITKSMIGIFGWMDTPLAEWIIVVGFTCLTILMITKTNLDQKAWLSRSEKYIVLLVMAAYWVGVSAALYMYYSPVGFKIIVGLQGRYFLPLLLPLAIVLYGNFAQTSTKKYRLLAVAAPLFLLTCSAITILFRYYIRNV